MNPWPVPERLLSLLFFQLRVESSPFIIKIINRVVSIQYYYLRG